MMETWLPQKLHLLRVRQGLTLVEAAEKTGVSRATLSSLERGHSRPVAATLRKIAEGYSVPIEELLEEPATVPKATAPASSPRETTGADVEGIGMELEIILNLLDDEPNEAMRRLRQLCDRVA